MTEAPRSRRVPALLPGLGVGPLWLLAAIFVLSLFAAMELIGVAAAVGTLQAWPARLNGALTVAVTGGGLESADAAAARALEILNHTPGVTRAWIVEPAPGDDIAGDMMGLTGTGGTTRLLGLGTAPGQTPQPGRIAATLSQAGLKAAIDDHGLTSGPLERAAAGAAAVAAGAFGLLLLVSWGLSARAAASALTTRAERVLLLIQFGARDAAFARPFRSWAPAGVFPSALSGAAFAAGLAGAPVASPNVAAWLAAQGLPIAALSAPDLAAAAIWPPMAALLAYWAIDIAARATARQLS